MDEAIAERIDERIREFFATTDVDFWFEPSHTLRLLTIGELVDRLTIVNIKLFKLKDYQQSSNDGVGLARSAKADVELCRERSNIKNAITEKILDMASKVYNQMERSDSNEVKLYGDT